MQDKYFKCHYCSFKVPKFRTRKRKGASGPDAQWDKLSRHIELYHGIEANDDYHEVGIREFRDMESKASDRDGWDW